MKLPKPLKRTSSPCGKRLLDDCPPNFGLVDFLVWLALSAVAPNSPAWLIRSRRALALAVFPDLLEMVAVWPFWQVFYLCSGNGYEGPEFFPLFDDALYHSADLGVFHGGTMDDDVVPGIVFFLPLPSNFQVVQEKVATADIFRIDVVS